MRLRGRRVARAQCLQRPHRSRGSYPRSAPGFAFPGASRRFDVSQGGLICRRRCWIDEHTNTSDAGYKLAQKFEPFRRHLSRKQLTPVKLPPGRARLVTRPSLTGSSGTRKTIGIVGVAALAANAAGGPIAAIATTGRRASSAASAGSRPIDCRPSDIRRLRSRPRQSPILSGPREMRVPGPRYRRATRMWRKPITGIAACCARAASGHATAAPPSRVMNSRRLTSSMGSPSGTRWASLPQP